MRPGRSGLALESRRDPPGHIGNVPGLLVARGLGRWAEPTLRRPARTVGNGPDPPKEVSGSRGRWDEAGDGRSRGACGSGGAAIRRAGRSPSRRRRPGVRSPRGPTSGRGRAGSWSSALGAGHCCPELRRPLARGRAGWGLDRGRCRGAGPRCRAISPSSWSSIADDLPRRQPWRMAAARLRLGRRDEGPRQERQQRTGPGACPPCPCRRTHRFAIRREIRSIGNRRREATDLPGPTETLSIGPGS